MSNRYLVPTLGSVLVWAILVGVALVAAALGTSSTGTLVTQMLINAIIVLGLQVFIGNTGILSFGHPAFGAYAGYVVAILTMPVSRKILQIPNAPFGLAEVEASTAFATLLAVALTLVVGVVVGLALVRSGAKSGAVAATMITLAFLFITHEIALGWTELTDGGGGLGFIPRLDGRLPIIVTLLVTILVVRWFAESKPGRLARATREDDVAAAAVGISRVGPQMIALMLSVLIIAVGAVLRVRALGSMTPSFFYFDYTLVTLAMLVVGGRMSMTGSMLGVAVITMGTEVTRFLAADTVSIAGLDWLLRPNLSSLFLGGAMLGFMLWRPHGLVGSWELDDWLRRFFPRSEPERPSGTIDTPAAQKKVLRATGLGAVFHGFRALGDVSIDVASGEVVGLIGPNGAGKTTLINAVSGLVPGHEGSVHLDGQEVTGYRPHELARAGIGRTFQNLRLFDGFTVRENVEVARLVAKSHRERTLPSADALLHAAGLWDLQDRRASELDYGNQRRLELARAAAGAPDFLLLDEPTSGMGETESAAMVDHVRSIAAAIGAGVLVIDHDLHFIVNICDRVFVLDHGELIAAGPPEVIREDALVKTAYLGED